ncbi:MAG TPA: hypothetical protein VF153_06425, partial [Candidatus Limnocylindria bacterium]
MEANFVATWQLVAATWRGELHEGNGLTWHSFRGPNDDPRATSVLRVNLTEGQADAAIDELRGRLRQRGPAVWWTWRESRPSDIGKRLLRRGMEAWPAWPGMAMELDALPPPPVHDDFSVDVVRTDEE